MRGGDVFTDGRDAVQLHEDIEAMNAKEPANHIRLRVPQVPSGADAFTFGLEGALAANAPNMGNVNACKEFCHLSAAAKVKNAPIGGYRLATRAATLARTRVGAISMETGSPTHLRTRSRAVVAISPALAANAPPRGRKASSMEYTSTLGTMLSSVCMTRLERSPYSVYLRKKPRPYAFQTRT